MSQPTHARVGFSKFSVFKLYLLLLILLYRQTSNGPLLAHGTGLLGLSDRDVNSLTKGRAYVKSVGLKMAWLIAAQTFCCVRRTQEFGDQKMRQSRAREAYTDRTE